MTIIYDNSITCFKENATNILIHNKQTTLIFSIFAKIEFPTNNNIYIDYKKKFSLISESSLKM